MTHLFSYRPQSTVFRWVIVLVLLSFVFTACTPEPQISLTPSPVQPTLSTETQSPGSPAVPVSTTTVVPGTATSAPMTLSAASYIPALLLDDLQLPENILITDASSDADIILELSDRPTGASWVYALVAPFPTTTKGLSSIDLKAAWSGEDTSKTAGHKLLVSPPTRDLFTAWWGQPDVQVVQVIPAGGLLDYAWKHQPAWAIIPFEELESQWKVLEVDDQSPLHNDFDLQTYPLTVYFSARNTSAAPNSLASELHITSSNRDPSKLTVLTMTGVTALVRGTALWMDRYGITYPAQDIGELLRQADLTHISNEIPFVSSCPYPSIPTPVPTEQPQPLISFCSSPEYIALLEEVGTDLVELTGDHFADWGDEAMLFTLDMYSDHNIPVYGGGINAEQARQPLLIENNGNKLAFIGCNIGWPARRDQIPESALAKENHPGAAQCDFGWLSTEIPRLRAEGYQVIFTFQHREYDRMKAEPLLVEDFRLIASYGATIVSGSQAHQPHSLDFENGAFIHYGLGNLFFDQYHFCADYACDYAFIDRHIFYDNRYIGTELIPIVFVDLARSRLMTEIEGAAYLEKIFTASGWTPYP